MAQKRPAGVIITGIIQILGSLFALLMSASMLIVPKLAEKSSATPPPLPASYFYVFGVVYGLFAVIGLLTAIGLFRLKSWARYSTLIFAPIPLLVGIGLALVFVILPFLPGQSADPQYASAMHALGIVMLVIGGCIASLGGFWLYYFNRSSVKLAFELSSGDAVSSSGVMIGGRRVPLSIVVIAGLSLFGALGSLPGLFLKSPTLLFGHVFTGWSATAIFLILAVVQVFVGIALLRLQNYGRLLGIAVQCIVLINGVALYFIPVAQLQEFYSKMPLWTSGGATDITTGQMIVFLKIAMSAVVVSSLVILYFLITRAWAFREGGVAEVPSSGQ